MAKNSQIDSDSIILVGDKVDLVVQTGQVYRAMIEDRLDDGPFLIAVPSRRGIPMSVAQDDDIFLVFYRESGRYVAQMKAIGFERRGEIRYMWLLQKTLAQKNQRRGAYRLPVSFSVQIYEYDKERGLTAGVPASAPDEESISGQIPEDEARAVALEKADTKDLSITGIALITKKKYIPGEKYVLVMKMESKALSLAEQKRAPKRPPLYLAAEVKRCMPWRVSGKYDIGMHFTDMTRQTSEEISKFVLDEQQRQIQLRRLS